MKKDLLTIPQLILMIMAISVVTTKPHEMGIVVVLILATVILQVFKDNRK